MVGVLAEPVSTLGLALGTVVLVVVMVLLVVVLLVVVVEAGCDVKCNNDDLTAADPACGLLPYLPQGGNRYDEYG